MLNRFYSVRSVSKFAELLYRIRQQNATVAVITFNPDPTPPDRLREATRPRLRKSYIGRTLSRLTNHVWLRYENLLDHAFPTLL